MLMGVGLSAVFVVLLLVICFGNILIKVVNKLAPEEEKPSKAVATKAAPALVDAGVQQAIAKAVDQITNGQGRVLNIQKL